MWQQIEGAVENIVCKQKYGDRGAPGAGKDFDWEFTCDKGQVCDLVRPRTQVGEQRDVFPLPNERYRLYYRLPGPNVSDTPFEEGQEPCYVSFWPDVQVEVVLGIFLGVCGGEANPIA